MQTRLFRFLYAATALLCLLIPLGCKKPPEPVTITFLDPEGLLDLGDHHMISETALQEFTKATGIRVNHLPTPENNREQLQLATELLQNGAATPDVYGIDTIWSGALYDYLIDLKPSYSPDMLSKDPEVLASYMVQGRLVAMPYHPNFGVLYYRADLLHKYGYSEPPRTWDELETMAAHIQKGERAAGKKDFSGLIWPGTVNGESLSNEGLEWQVGEGGGMVIEADKTISVNNPNVIHAWERAAHWVGWISPPDVLSYTEWDVSNSFWISGNAAFARGWSDYFQRHPPGVPFRQMGGVTSIPSGKGSRVSTLGGYALGISKTSAHRAEAIQLVQFLARREAQGHADDSPQERSRQLELYELPTMLSERYPSSQKAGEKPGASIISRPSGVSGAKYSAVSRAYVVALHSVLARQSTAADAAAKLEKELVQITGFPAARK